MLGFRKKQSMAPWISQEVLEHDQRGQLKEIRARSEENRKMYAKEFKKKAKQCKEQWLEKRCLEVEELECLKLFHTVN